MAGGKATFNRKRNEADKSDQEPENDIEICNMQSAFPAVLALNEDYTEKYANCVNEYCFA